MPNTNTQNNNGQEPVSRNDLVELVLEPLASLVDQGRFEILKKIQDIEGLIDTLAAQVKRDLDDRNYHL
jgi:hypothetical protein